MPECPACLGDGELDFADMDAPLERLSRALGLDFDPIGVQTCTYCDGSGWLTDDAYRDLAAWAVARVDQFQAAVDAGEIAAP